MLLVDDIDKLFISSAVTISNALKQLDVTGKQILLVIDDKKDLLGIVTDGDFRRAILDSVDLSNPVSSIINTNYRWVFEESDRDEIVNEFLTNRIDHLLILDKNHHIKNIVMRGNLKYKDESLIKKPDNWIVIMAGGKGNRLHHLPKILPKPMIPLGDKPIIEVIMDRFNSFGFCKFLISVNYKKEIIKLYFQEINNLGYTVEFIEEEQPMGTIGSLSLSNDKFKDTVLVTNCDVIIEINYNQLLEFHHKSKNDITIVGSLRHFKIPYGVIHSNQKEFEKIDEKPEYEIMINTGLYCLEPGIIRLIPKDSHFDMTNLINKAQNKGKKIGIYPVYNSYFDVGQWEEYRKTLVHFDISEETE